MFVVKRGPKNGGGMISPPLSITGPAAPRSHADHQQLLHEMFKAESAPAATSIVGIERLSVIDSATEFIGRRLQMLGLENSSKISLSLISSGNGMRGRANSSDRSVVVEYEPASIPIDVAALLVHEAFHAIGHVAKSTKGGATKQGAALRGPGALAPSNLNYFMFNCLEEYAAYGNELLYRREHGFSQRKIFESCHFRFSDETSNPIDRAVVRATTAIHYRDEFNRLKSINGWNERIRDGTIVIPLQGILKISESLKLHRSTYAIPQLALDSLAYEIYREARNPPRCFCDDLTTAAMTGNLRPVLSKIHHVFGTEGVKFFACLNTQPFENQPTNHTKLDSILLALFAEARMLRSDLRTAIRAELAAAAQTFRYSKPQTISS